MTKLGNNAGIHYLCGMKATKKEALAEKKKLEAEIGRYCEVIPAKESDWVGGHIRRVAIAHGTNRCYFVIDTDDGRSVSRTADSPELRLLEGRVAVRQKKTEPRVLRGFQEGVVITEDNLSDHINTAESNIGRELALNGEIKGRIVGVSINRSAKPKIYYRLRRSNGQCLSFDIRYSGITIMPDDDAAKRIRDKYSANGDEAKRLLAGRKLYRLIEEKKKLTGKLRQKEQELGQKEQELVEIKRLIDDCNNRILLTKRIMLDTM